ncbi:MAG: LodA/GoxA family CTQ-dependent oxidase, partial [Mycobacteriales bacterium]
MGFVTLRVARNGCHSQLKSRISPPERTAERLVDNREAQGRIKRQAARFQVFVYDEASPEGRPLKIGDKVEGGGNHGTLTDIRWQGCIANKKAFWHQFDTTLGEHGYPPYHPRRNADVSERSRLIVDPGPRTVDGGKRRA